MRVRKFIKTVELRFKQEHWSFDACVGYSRRNREFARQEMVCTKTLYNYADRNILSIPYIRCAPYGTYRMQIQSAISAGQSL